MAFLSLPPNDLNENFINKIGKDWALLTAQSEGSANTMTVSWGGVGVLWGEPVAYVFVRPSRYTYEFIEKSEGFTLSFFESSHKKALGYLGSTSGRDENKIEKSGLTAINEDEFTYFEEANLVLCCKTMFKQPLDISTLWQGKIEDFYPEGDVHTMYVGRIEKALKK